VPLLPRDAGADAEDDAEADDTGVGAAGGRAPVDLNMRAIFLHVLSDFAGSVGVVTSGLLITLLSWPGRFYLDPAIRWAMRHPGAEGESGGAVGGGLTCTWFAA
jgi:hypothetical protein